MTPAINALKKANIRFDIHEYQHNPDADSYGDEAVAALGLNPDEVFKTLLVSLSGHKSHLAVAVIPVSQRLNLKSIAKALGAKKADMADPKEAERSSGYVVGGISPVGQKKALPTVIDASAEHFAQINVSAGRRGLEISLAPQDLAIVTRAIFASLTND